MRASVIGRVADRSASRQSFRSAIDDEWSSSQGGRAGPGRHCAAEVETSLLTALSDSGDDVRYLAADALGDVRTAAVIQAIETRLAAETSPVVRSALLAAKNKLDLAASR